MSSAETHRGEDPPRPDTHASSTRRPLSTAEPSQALHDQSANELACRAQTGCADAFMELVNRYRPRLLRFVERRLGGNWADAEDVVQDTFTKAWDRLDRFDPQYQFTTWLYTIAANLSVDSQRRQARNARPLDLLDPRQLDQPDQAPTAQDILVQQEHHTNIWAIARQVLSQPQYSAMWLRYAEDLSVKEVAIILKKTNVGVRVLLHRARTVMQQHRHRLLDDQSETTLPSTNESGDVQ